MKVRTATVDELEDPAAAPALEPHRPGYCALHRQRLATHRATRNKAGATRWYGLEDPATVCLLCPPETDERCRWCGGPLWIGPDALKPYWRRSTRRAYCIPNHRLRAHRAAKGGPA